MLLHAAAVFSRGGLCRRAVARFDLAEGREALLVPAAQDRVAVGPFESARGQAGLFIGQADLLFAEAPGEPGQDIVLLSRREPAAGNAEQLLDLPQLRLAQELVLHVDRRLLHGVDAVVGPVIRFLLDRPQRRHPRDAARALPLDAVVDEDGDDLAGQAEIAVDREQNLHLLIAQDPAQPPLRLAGDGLEFAARVRLTDDVLLCIDRSLRRVEMPLRLLRPEAELLQRGAGQIIPRLAHAQRLARVFQRAARRKMEIQQRRVAVGGCQQPLDRVRRQRSWLRHGRRPLSVKAHPKSKAR